MCWRPERGSILLEDFLFRTGVHISGQLFNRDTKTRVIITMSQSTSNGSGATGNSSAAGGSGFNSTSQTNGDTNHGSGSNNIAQTNGVTNVRTCVCRVICRVPPGRLLVRAEGPYLPFGGRDDHLEDNPERRGERAWEFATLVEGGEDVGGSRCEVTFLAHYDRDGQLVEVEVVDWVRIS